MLKNIISFILFLGLSPMALEAKSIAALWPEEKLNCAKQVIEYSLTKHDFAKARNIATTCSDQALLDFVQLQYSIHSDSNKLDYYKLQNIADSISKFPNNISFELQIARAIKDPFELENAYQNYAQKWQENQDIYSIIASFLLKQDTADFNINHLEEIIEKAWLYSRLSRKRTEQFYQKYQPFISNEKLKQKISLLLSQKLYKAAQTLLKYTDSDYQKYYQIRKKFRNNHKYAPSSLKNIPKSYHFDEGLFYDIAWYFQRKGQENKIAKYITALPDNLHNPQIWYKIIALNSRYLIDIKDYEKAYKVATHHEMPQASLEFAELEWLSGWIALEYLKKPELAVKHFHNLDNNVSYPISKARAAYWLGRTYQDLQNEEASKQYFTKASLYITTFYGQMSLMELHDNFTIKLPQLILPNNKEMVNILTKDKLARLGIYLGYAGYKNQMKSYFKKAIENNPTQDFVSSVIALAEYQEDYVLANALAKHATKFNIVTSANYPIIKQVVNMQEKEKSLLHALIKQESGFHKKAVSSAGALGFMQLMPNTAREVAHKLKTSYNKKRLLNDAEYNIKLGSYYVNYLMNKFDGSYVLAIASYNAGPTNSRKWLQKNGDPREFSNLHQVINWIELIPFPETRNYVQRILENAVIYMHLLQN